MAIETTRDNVCINHIVAQKTENVIVEGDSIIPDIKPDIINSINTNGIVCIYKKEVNEGKVRLDGCVDTYITYLADSEQNNIRSLNVNLDFTQIIDVEKATPELNLETDVKLKNIECKVINGRKIGLKAFLEINIKLTSNEDIDIINNVNLKGIQILNKNLNINSLIGRGTTKTYAKDTLLIDNIDNLSEVMKVDLRISSKDVKISYNKVLAKSDLEVRLLYLTEDNRINSVESTIPVMGFVDIPNVSEENICDTKYEIRNIVVKPNNVEDHSVYIEVELEIYCEVYKNQEINLIQDLYCPKTNILFTQKQINIIQRRDTKQATCNIRETQQVPEIGSNKIYDVEVNVEIAKKQVLNDRIVFEGELKLNYIFNYNDEISTKSTTIPFEFTMDFPGVMQNSNIEVDTDIGTKDFIITADGSIDVKIDIIFSATQMQNAQINIIDDIKEDENRSCNTCSLVIYYVKEGDTLWKVAKKFGSTVDEIARINGIENRDKLNVAQQLFIPRYNG